METLKIFLIVLLVAAVVGIVAFVLYRILRPRLKEEKPTEEETGKRPTRRRFSFWRHCLF